MSRRNVKESSLTNKAQYADQEPGMAWREGLAWFLVCTLCLTVFGLELEHMALTAKVERYFTDTQALAMQVADRAAGLEARMDSLFKWSATNDSARATGQD